MTTLKEAKMIDLKRSKKWLTEMKQKWLTLKDKKLRGNETINIFKKMFKEVIHTSLQQHLKILLSNNLEVLVDPNPAF